MRLLLLTLPLVLAPLVAAESVQTERWTGYGVAFVSTASLEDCAEDTNVGGACFEVPADTWLRLDIREDVRPWGAIDGDWWDWRCAYVSFLDAEGELIRTEPMCSRGTYTFPGERPTAQVHVNVRSPVEDEAWGHASDPGMPSGTVTLATWS